MAGGDQSMEIPNDDELTALTLCSHFDKMALERVLGKKRADHMLSSNKSTFLFF